jgi:hypothetical protein
VLAKLQSDFPGLVLQTLQLSLLLVRSAEATQLVLYPGLQGLDVSQLPLL